VKWNQKKSTTGQMLLQIVSRMKRAILTDPRSTIQRTRSICEIYVIQKIRLLDGFKTSLDPISKLLE
jgi:hypothetical protein